MWENVSRTQVSEGFSKNARAVAPGDAPEGAGRFFSDLRVSRGVLSGELGGLFGTPGDALGRSGALLGRPWESLGCSGEILGRLMAAFWVK